MLVTAPAAPMNITAQRCYRKLEDANTHQRKPCQSNVEFPNTFTRCVSTQPPLREGCSETHKMNEVPAALTGGNPPRGETFGGTPANEKPSAPRGEAAPPDCEQRHSLQPPHAKSPKAEEHQEKGGDQTKLLALAPMQQNLLISSGFLKPTSSHC